MVERKTVPTIEDQTLGIVFPIYAWGVPEPVLEFVKRLNSKPSFTFGVCTCGAEAGDAMHKLNLILPLNSTYSVSMPSNCIMGADLESNESISSKITKAKVKLEMIAAQVNARQSVHDVNKGPLAWIKTNLANFGFNMAARSTKPFYVTDKCISCRECAETVPQTLYRWWTENRNGVKNAINAHPVSIAARHKRSNMAKEPQQEADISLQNIRPEYLRNSSTEGA